MLHEQSIFTAALEIPSVKRREFLDRECASDPALRQRVERLLAAHENAIGFMNQPAGNLVPTTASSISEGAGTSIGRYKLLQQIGEGGFGVVFMAQQSEPVRRRVALKIIKPGMDSKQVIARFAHEQQALAMMDHPHIAQVHDGGVTESGRPYFVMELVTGVPITQYCDENNSTVEERLRLFMQVCRAVQHAHQKGIIHRDLKPSNVLVTLHDGEPVVKVIDFGVSKAINQQLTEQTMFTAFGQMVGTIQYMSPEQAEMSGLDIDTRSDIYSLGVLLYELLTGTTPLETERLRSLAYAEMQRVIREEDPPRPSLRLSQSGNRATVVATHRSADPHRLRQSVRGDLDWIVMKTLDKNRTRRYDTATALLRDIERFLSHEPVEAGPPSTVYRLKKLIRRRRMLAACVSIVAVALVGSTAWALRSSRHETEARIAADMAGLQAVSEKRNADSLRDEAERQGYRSSMYSAGCAWDRSEITLVRDLLDQYRTGSGREDMRRWEWYYLWRAWTRNEKLLRTNSIATADDLSSPTLSVTDDGTRLALTSGFAPIVNVWDTRSVPPRTVHRCGDEHRGSWNDYVSRISPDGKLIAYCGRGRETLLVEELETRTRTEHDFEEGVQVVDCAFTSGGDVIATATSDLKVRIFDRSLQDCLATFDLERHNVVELKFIDDQRVVTGDNGGRVLVWNVTTGQVERDLGGHSDGVRSLAVSRDGTLIVSGSGDQTVKLWDWPSGNLVRTLTGFPHETWVALSPDSTLLAVGAGGFIRLWNLRDHRELQSIRGSRGREIGFLSDEQVTFQNTYHQLSICSIDDLSEDCVLRPRLPVMAMVLYVSQGNLMLAGYPSRDDAPGDTNEHAAIQRWNVQADRPVELQPFQPGFDVGAMTYLPSQGLWALGVANKPSVKLYADLEGADPTSLDADGDGGVSGLAFSADGNRLAVGLSDGHVLVWKMDVESGSWQIDEQWNAHSAAVHRLTFHPRDDRILTTASKDWSVKLWERGPQRQVRQTWNSIGPVGSIAFSPSGSELALCDFSGKISVVNWQQSSQRVFHGHRISWTSVAFLADANTMLSTNQDGTFRVWDIPTGRERFMLDIGTPLVSLAVSPDETVVALGTNNGAIRLLRRATNSVVAAAGW